MAKLKSKIKLNKTKMKKDLFKIGAMSFIAALLFIFNPVQDYEINAKLAHMCIDNPQIPCEDVVDYCEQSLREGFECYIINPNME